MAGWGRSGRITVAVLATGVLLTTIGVALADTRRTRDTSTADPRPIDPTGTPTSTSTSTPTSIATSTLEVGAPASSVAADVSSLHSWLSGAASDESADGRYGAWRGSPIQVGGTWDNGDSEQVAMRTICPGGPWAGWDKPLDVAIGAIDVGRGESWAAAARGGYDARWTQNLKRIAGCWGKRDPAKLYIRFAHEMNLHGMKWRVRGGEEADFVKAITRYSDLRYKILPTAKIVLCPNDGTELSLNGLDIRKLWPGKDAQNRPVANVYAVDSYNMNPHVITKAAFTKKINGQYANGMPLGIEKHRQFAASVGVPFAIGEWGNNGNPRNGGGGGESALYVREFYAWARAHAGNPAAPKPGQLLYEVHFNLWGDYAFWPKTRQPQTAAVYRSLPWGR